VQEFFFDDHLILHHPATNKLIALNTTGQFIWENFSKGMAAEDIADCLVSQFSIGTEQALNDVESCLAEWEQIGFTESVNDSTSSRYSLTTEDLSDKSSALHAPVDWHSSQRIRVAGRNIEINYGDLELRETLVPVFQHLEAVHNSPPEDRLGIWQHDNLFFVDSGDSSIHSTASKDEAVGWILYYLVIQTFSRDDCSAVLHGGAVRHGDSAIILPGGKGSGKSTLIAALQHDGYEYLSDDVCLLKKEDGLLVPVPMSQRIKSGSWKALESLYPSLTDLPVYKMLEAHVKFLSPATGCMESWNRTWPVAAIIFPQYQAQAALTVQHLRPLETLELLMNGDGLGNDCLQSLLTWLEKIPAFKMVYSRLAEAQEHFTCIVEELPR